MKILVIDDEHEFISILQQWFSRRGHLVHGVTDIRTVPDVLASDRYDVISLDLNMPNSPGFTWIEKIHAISPDTPIIMTTAQADPYSAKLALQSGAAEFVCKPVNLTDLEKALTQAHANRDKVRPLFDSGRCYRNENPFVHGHTLRYASAKGL